MKRFLLTLVFLAGCAPIVPDKPAGTQSDLNVAQAQCNYCVCGPFYRRTGSARPTPVASNTVMEAIVARDNLKKALARVKLLNADNG